MAGLQAFSGTVFINVLPSWNVSKTRLASVFTSKGLGLEIAQSKDVRAGNCAWEIICKGQIPPPQFCLVFLLPSSGWLSSSKLNWRKYILVFSNTDLFIFYSFLPTKLPIDFLTCVFLLCWLMTKPLTVPMLPKQGVLMLHWSRHKRNYTFKVLLFIEITYVLLRSDCSCYQLCGEEACWESRSLELQRSCAKPMLYWLMCLPLP